MQNTIPRNIRADLIRAGVTQSEISDQLGITVSCVCDVISGRRATPRIREAIAKAINKSVAEIWPGPSTRDAST